VDGRSRSAWFGPQLYWRLQAQNAPLLGPQHCRVGIKGLMQKPRSSGLPSRLPPGQLDPLKAIWPTLRSHAGLTHCP
jgi:hypothetical protein